MNTTKIKTVQGLITFVKNNSSWQTATISHVFLSLGFTATDGAKGLKELSGYLSDCVRHGADGGFPGFIYYADTVAFFFKHRKDIVNNIEQTAADLGMDIFARIQSFGIYRTTDKPTPSEIGRALWGTGHHHSTLNDLYNVLAWYALEEIANVWLRYLEDNPGYCEELSA